MMKFYSVKVGNRTKRGGFNELHSFVCQSEVSQSYEVAHHYQEKYEGFDVVAEEVVNIETMPLKPSQNPIQKGRINELQKEVKELKKQLLPSEEYNYVDKIYKEEWPEGARVIIRQAKEAYKKHSELIKQGHDIIQGYIQEKNRNTVEWIRAKGGFEDDYTKYSYEVRLKGKLITTRKKDENE